MPEAKHTATTESNAPKRTLRDRLPGGNTDPNSESKLKNLGSKAKTAAAVVGVATVGVVAYASIAKRKTLKVQVTAPDVDVTTESA